MEENKKETKPVEPTEEKKVEAVKEEKMEEKKVDKVKEEPKNEIKKQEPSKATNKKVEPTKKVKVENSKKTNNNTIIIGVGVLIVVAVAIIISMVFMKPSPKKAVEDSFNQLKAGTYAQEMLAGIMQGEDNVEAEAQKLCFEKLQWKVLSEKEEGETAKVEVEVTNKDFQTIMSNYMQKALKAAFSGNTNQDEMSNYLMEELRNEEVQTVTNTHTLTLQKQDGKWEITDEETFVKAVLPGLYEAISAFSK
ncbi:MAG: hypothetical protein HFJ34_00375 [Clostridia bacterium]|nr:hypothetical protein [Clostridia bacterium]